MSSFRVVIPPATEPLTLEQVKQHLRVEHDEDDTLVAGYLAAAREEFERVGNRAIVAQTCELQLACFLPEIRLPRPPIQAVQAITYLDANGDQQTLAADQYRVLRYEEPARIVPAYNVVWPITYEVADAVTISYVAGWGVPLQVDPATDELTADGRTYADDDRVLLSVAPGDTLPGGISGSLVYFVVNAAGATFELALTSGGAAIDITDEGTGQLWAGPIPEGIRNYLLLMTAHRYENREAGAERAVTQVPLAAESLFWAHRALEA